MIDAEIDECRKYGGACPGQACPDYARCLELARQNAARQFSTETEEEVEE